MIEHLGNCHGEMTLLMTVLTGIPFIGYFIRKFTKRKNHHHRQETTP